MTNKQWLLEKMQNMSDEELGKIIRIDELGVCKERSCGACTCYECRIDWLKSEHKEQIKLSDAERVILENLPKDYKWIARDDIQDILWIFTEKPTKNHRWWANESNFKIGVSLSLFNHLFQFIKWEDTEPYNIEELLKGK